MKLLCLLLVCTCPAVALPAVNWTGSVSTNWHTPGNWSGGPVPDASTAVIVPEVASGNYPLVSNSAGYCGSLTVEAGASLTVGANNLNVTNDAVMHGQLNMTAGTDFRVAGTIYWQPGSAANITNSGAGIVCGVGMTFLQGSNVQLANGTVRFQSENAACYLVNRSSATSFHNIRSSCTGTGFLSISGDLDAQDFAINGSLGNDSLSTIHCAFTGTITLRGNLTDYNVSDATDGIRFDNGTLRMDGADQSINLASQACYLKNLACSQSGILSLAANLALKGNLAIESGIFDPGGWGIKLGGNWTNSAGSAAFDEAGSTVTFAYTTDSYIYANEYFDAVVLDKGFPGASLTIPQGSALDCQSYDWAQGSLTVGGGLFYVRDMVDASIRGSVTLTSGSIVLIQDFSQYLDLSGNLNISGGEFHIHGGVPGNDTYMPWNISCIFSMSAGLFYRHGSGLTIDAGSYLLTTNISGGTIRVDGQFYCERDDFQPAGGTLELYGSANANLTMLGGNLRNLRIDKNPPADSENPFPEGTWVTQRDGSQALMTRANKVTVTSDVLVAGDLNVASGTLDLNGNELSCWDDAFVDGILTVDAGAALFMTQEDYLQVNFGGRLEVLGGLGDAMARLTASSGYYNLNVLSGAVIAAEWGIFEGMGPQGVNVMAGANIDPEHSFGACVFRNGISGGTLLTLDNAACLLVSNAVFPANTWGGASNVRKTVDAGTVNFANASGTFQGEAFDNDGYGRIYWNTASAAFDLQILSAFWCPASPPPYLGDARILKVTVLNNSTSNCPTTHYLDLYYTRSASPALHDPGNQYAAINFLPAGLPVELTFAVANYSAALAGVWNSYLQIDSGGDVVESAETNNVYGPFNINWLPLPVPEPQIASLPGTNGVVLNWIYPISVSGFNIYADTSPYGAFSTLAGTSATTSFTDGTAGPRRFYRVKAVRTPPAFSEPRNPVRRNY